MRGAVRFYFFQFLFGFGRHVPLVLTSGMMFVLIFVSDVNQAFGIRNLLWHEDEVKQGAVGFALGVVIVQTLLAGYLLETKQTPSSERPSISTFGPALTYGVGILACILVTGAPILLAVGPHWGTIVGGWPLLLGFAVAMCLYFVGVTLLPRDAAADSWVTKLGHKLFDGLAQIKLLHVPKAEPIDMPVHGIACVAMIFSVLVYAVVGAGPFLLFSPLVGVFALLGILVAGFGFVQYFLDYVHPALAMLAVGLIYMGGLSHYGLRFPDLANYYAQPVKLSEYSPSQECDLLPPEAIQFCSEKRGPYGENQKRPLVVVCVSGGGLRAAAWTTAVLHKLEQSFVKYVDEQGLPAPIDFPCHIRVIAGASGGMVGAGYYVANLPNPPQSPLERFDLYRHYDAVTDDCLTPIVHAMTYHDIRSVFSPFGRPRDRGQALEAAWTENMRGVLDQSFDRLRDGEKAGWRPSLVFSPMLVEEGRRLLISNLDLRGVASNDGTIIQEDRDLQTDPTLPARKLLNRFSYESYEFFRLFPQTEVRKTFRVATAARMSASFPYVSSAPTLPTDPRRRVVDAGYYDNDGVSLAASWLFSGSNRDWLRKNVSKILLVQIRDGASEGRRKLKDWLPDQTSAMSRGLEFLTTPPTALFSARVGSSSFRNDGLLEILSQQLISELQLKPLLEQLDDHEIAILTRAKERDTALGLLASMSGDPEKMQQLRRALATKGQQESDPQKMDKLDDLAWLADTARFTPADKAQWDSAMKGLRHDTKPDVMVDRLLRRAELQAASFQLTPGDEAELKSSLYKRIKHKTDADTLLRQVRMTFDRDSGNPFFTTIDFEFTGEASLSWFLTSKEKRDILTAADGLAGRIRLLQEWWRAPGAQDGDAGK
jgi:Patatin-like phospholipase